jgi:hypothetical protein
MAFELFGWQIKKSEKEVQQKKAESFVLPENQDGAVNVEGLAGAYGGFIDFDATVKNEFELVTRYRELSLLPDVDFAIDDIVNEMIVMDGVEDSVRINLEKVKLNDGIKSQIRTEFLNILALLDWDNQGYEIVKKWYIDGRLYFHTIIDESNPKHGIQELRYIDPRQIRKVREIQRDIDQQTGTELLKVIDEYFTYNSRGIQFNSPNSYSSVASTGLAAGTKISTDSICYTHSGIVDKYSTSILSHLHKAIKPINQLKMMEDALVIYRIARAPERRIFYVDVGNLPKSKADAYLRSVMDRYRNKLQYNIETGEMKDGRRFMSMLEDYWLPRREGSTGTSIETLPGGENLGEMKDVEYFQKQVYRALNVPVSRLDTQNGFQLGRAAEITRDEVKFAKFIHRIRLRFSHVFDELLRKQLILKNIISVDDWFNLKNSIKFDFNMDNHYSELKDNEILKTRLDLLQSLDGYVGKYYSSEWIKRNVLKQSEDDINLITSQIKKEGGVKDANIQDNSQQLHQEPRDVQTTDAVPMADIPDEEIMNNNESHFLDFLD